MKKNRTYGLLYEYGLLKMIKIMRFTIFILFLSLSQAFAMNSYSQQTKLSLDLKNVRVEDVIDHIEKNSEFFFMYNKDMINVDRKIDFKVEEKSIDEILNKLFENTDISYSIKDRQILLINNRMRGNEFVSQQQKTITGKVTDKKGQPLPGVTVLVKGTTTGTITDFDGNYNLSNISSDAILAFSFVGMSTQEVHVTGKNQINIILEEEVIGLDEVVAVGYGTQSRQTLTTSISKLDNHVLENIPYSNVAQALTGTIAGARVQNVSGMPGESPRIIIRGGTSINNPDGATPLYIVDGVYRTNLDNINPDDIQSINVLKDAASTAIYGTLGSNGVVIVETKSGGKDKVSVNYKYDKTFSQASRKYDLLHEEDFVKFARLGMRATADYVPTIVSQLSGNTYVGGIGNDLTNNTYSTMMYLTSENQYKLSEGWMSTPDPLDPSKTIIFSDTDFHKLLFRTAVSNNHTLNVSGGNNKVTFYLGVGYSDVEGIAINTSYDRYSFNFNSEYKITDKIKIFGRVMYNKSSDDNVSSQSVFKSELMAPPTNKIYNEDGTLAIGRNFAYGNPLLTESIDFPKNIDNDLSLIIGGYMEIMPGLTFEPQFSYNQTINYFRTFRKAYMSTSTTLNTERAASASAYFRYSPQLNGVFTYVKSFNDSHNIQAKMGTSFYSINIDQLSGKGKSSVSDNILTMNASAVPVSVYGYESEQTILGYFARTTYDYNQKYLASASLRYDGASNLGSSKKWGLFPAISLGWNIDKENFWKLFPENLVNIKLRGSYGVNGNISGLGAYAAQGEYSLEKKYDSNGAVLMSIMPNDNLQWERSKTTDIGLDVGFFNRRINILVDLYRRKTDNLLTNLPLPYSSGFASVLTNYGSLENKGYEIELNANILPSTSELKWNLKFNISDVQTKILQLPDNGIEKNRVGGVYIWDEKLGDYAWGGGLQEGGRIGELFGYKQVSVFKDDAEAANAPIDDLILKADKTKHGGDVNWLDADGDGHITSKDQVYMGNLYPTISGGLSNNLMYKNLSLIVRMDYIMGGTIYYETGARLEGNFSGANAISSNILKSWQKPGDVTDVPRYYWADQNVNRNVYRQSSRHFEKTNFLSIREVTLAYDLPKRWIEKAGLDNIRLNITGSNLYYFTAYEGLNPEQTSGDYAYPVPREFTFSVSVNF